VSLHTATGKETEHPARGAAIAGREWRLAEEEKKNSARHGLSVPEGTVRLVFILDLQWAD